ncbi:acireductone synthase [Streptomyces platensis]|uniref:acireductone synthase n=1 Tax=Streptomyces platensis TaxID=58346 RepID=UPI0037BB75B5
MTGVVVLDIEGTTSSAAHVHQVLFPYARERLAEWVARHRDEPEVQQILAEVGRYLDSGTCIRETAVVHALEKWSDEDRKAGPLKRLQGMIWAEGYARKELTGHVYPDTVEALEVWSERGTAVYIYSSGSIQAQQQWFRHSPYGDLRGHVAGYFDTSNAGPKQLAASYRTIAASLALPPHTILFASDVPAELDAAHAAGWCTVLIRRACEEQSLPSRVAPASRSHHPLHHDLLSVARKAAA